MRIERLVIVAVVMSCLLAWIRHDDPFALRQAVPFASGARPSFYDVVQLGMIVIAARAARRIWQRNV